MRTLKLILPGVLLYLAMEAGMIFLQIVEVANPNLFLTILQLGPWATMGAVLMIAVLAVTVPWKEVW